MAIQPYKLMRIEIQNLRGFAQLAINFALDAGPYVIIGKNGTCKTTLLRAIAAVFGNGHGARQFFARAGTLAKPGMTTSINAELKPDAGDEFGRFLIFDAKALNGWGTIGHEEEAFVCAYGVSRFFSGSNSSVTSGYTFEDATATLFNMQNPLTEPELTVRRLRDRLKEDKFRGLWHLLERLIGLSERQTIHVVKGGGLEIRGPEQVQDFYSWADGHRVTFTWVLDFFAQAMKADAFDENGDIQGVLLVDEIEQHLHPSMQLEILPKLQALLPKCQIIVTTHSPLVALSVPSDHVISLQRQADGTIARTPTPDLTGYSAEDVLVHPNLFDAPAETKATETARAVFKNALVYGLPRDELSVREASQALAKPSRGRLAEVDPELALALKKVQHMANKNERHVTLRDSTGVVKLSTGTQKNLRGTAMHHSHGALTEKIVVVKKKAPRSIEKKEAGAAKTKKTDTAKVSGL